MTVIHWLVGMLARCWFATAPIWLTSDQWHLLSHDEVGIEYPMLILEKLENNYLPTLSEDTTSILLHKAT